MNVPGLLERVRLSGLDEVFLVTRVDDAAQEAVYGRRQLECVPFIVIEASPGCGPPRLRIDA